MTLEVQKRKKSELAGWVEGVSGPSQHECSGPGVLDAALSRGRVILVCYHCGVYWWTGSQESDYLTPGKLTIMADALYALSSKARKRLLVRLHEPNVRQMYRDYRRGLSLNDTGRMYGYEGTAVRDKFVKAGFKPRHPGQPIRNPVIKWHGRVYTWTRKGYYRLTMEPRSLLHRDVWEHHNGPIPEGYEVARLDNNPHNNRLSNLVCLPKDEASLLQHAKLKKIPPLKHCLNCGEIMPRHRPNGPTKGHGVREGYAAYMKRKTCGPKCAAALKKGQPRGWRMP